MSNNDDNRRFDEYLAFRNQNRSADWKQIALGVFVGGFALTIAMSILIVIFAALIADANQKAYMKAIGVSQKQVEKMEAELQRKIDR